MKSDNVRVGMQQAPHRSLFNALGMTKEEMERPLVGIVCSYNEIVSGHMTPGQDSTGSKDGSCHGRWHTCYVPGDRCV